MKGCVEVQAAIRGECRFRCVSGCIRVSPMRCGSIVQVHIHGLPCELQCFGLCIELCGKRIPLPSLINAGGEALLSVYTNDFSPREALGASALITADPCSPCACAIACGRFHPAVRQDCCLDPRPLFASLIRM